MDNKLIAFSHDFQQQILLNMNDSQITDEDRENCFTDYMINCIIEDGTIEDGTAIFYKKTGIQINGYYIQEETGIIDIFVSRYNGSSPPVIVGKKDIESSFKRVFTFLKRSIEGNNNNLEQGKPLNDFIKNLYEQRDSITKVNLYFLTDGIVKKVPDMELSLGNIKLEQHIWDIERLYRSITSGENREVIEINFEQLGGKIPCLAMSENNTVYETFLAILPAEFLVDIYGKYRSRLLEGNVRSFLQIRGNVNKGIRQTIKNEPNMFLAYNNGISAVAEKAEIINVNGTLFIKKIRNLQIVNGGQTTATLFQVNKKERVSLKGVNIQLKLTVVSDSSKMDEIVPKISEYANSQNKIQTADFSSNHPYHRAIEELSRTVWAPVLRGHQRQTKWYFERTRGQYLVDRSRENTLTFKRNFDAEYPKSQKFDKTDLAKYINVWLQKPYLISRGAQKNFNEFMEWIGEENISPPTRPKYEDIIALAVIYKQAEKLINNQKNNYPAYRSYILAYSLSWIFYVKENEINLGYVWKNQEIPDTIKESLNYIFSFANKHITNAPGNGNITEWCKKEDCWDAFVELDIDIPSSLLV